MRKLSCRARYRTAACESESGNISSHSQMSSGSQHLFLLLQSPSSGEAGGFRSPLAHPLEAAGLRSPLTHPLEARLWSPLAHPQEAGLRWCRVDTSGMVSLDRAEAVLERMETVNVTVAVPANETAGGAPKASVTAAFGLRRCSRRYSVPADEADLLPVESRSLTVQSSQAKHFIYRNFLHAARFRGCRCRLVHTGYGDPSSGSPGSVRSAPSF